MLTQACNPCIWEVKEKFKVMLDYIMSLKSSRDIPDPGLKRNKESLMSGLCESSE